MRTKDNQRTPLLPNKRTKRRETLPCTKPIPNKQGTFTFVLFVNLRAPIYTPINGDGTTRTPRHQQSESLVSGWRPYTCYAQILASWYHNGSSHHPIHAQRQAKDPSACFAPRVSPSCAAQPRPPPRSSNITWQPASCSAALGLPWQGPSVSSWRRRLPC